MSDRKGKEKAIAKRGQKGLAKSEKAFTVASLEKAMLKEFPRKDAEDWDVMGLTVGEGALPVASVAVALDPTVEAIDKAAALGANVLVTHHPPFVEAPKSFAPARSVAASPGAGVWAAIRNGVALMNFHTSLDVSRRAQAALPQMLGFKYTGKLVETIESSKRKGYGQICQVPSEGGKPESLGHVAARCVSVFGRAPRVYGNFDSPVSVAVCALGSASNVAHGALETGADVLVCGEIKYHDALDLSQAGLSVIELGHDVSELPLAAVLAKTLSDVGVKADAITILDQSANWSHPETIRL